MRVIILGACGGMGRYVAKSVSSIGQIDHKKLLMEIYESFGMKDAKIIFNKSW